MRGFRTVSSRVSRASVLLTQISGLVSVEMAGLTSPWLPWRLVLEDRSRLYTARDKRGLQPKLPALPSCHHLLAVTRSSWGQGTMTAQCVGGPPLWGRCKSWPGCPGDAACARDAWAWGRHRECLSQLWIPRGCRSFRLRGGLALAQTEGGREGESYCQTSSQAHLPFPGLLSALSTCRPFGPTGNSHLSSGGLGPRLGARLLCPSCLMLGPSCSSQPEATVLGPSDDRIGLPPLSRLCIRLWKLEPLPSPPGQGRVDYRTVGPQLCCLLLCKL